MNLWQGRRHLGTARANEPGTPIWNELHTPDIGRATRFYADVFGLSVEESAVAWGAIGTYTTLSAAGRRIAAAVPPLEGAPPHWNVYFNVVDIDESVAQAEALGAKLITPPYDVDDQGRMAALTDPQGAMFSLMVR